MHFDKNQMLMIHYNKSTGISSLPDLTLGKCHIYIDYYLFVPCSMLELVSIVNPPQ